jgi:hypothetical protein
MLADYYKYYYKVINLYARHLVLVMQEQSVLIGQFRIYSVRLYQELQESWEKSRGQL